MLKTASGNHDLTHFSGGMMERGDFVYRTKKAREVVKRVTKTKHIHRAIGVTLNSVVDIDLSHAHYCRSMESVLGSKIHILTSGTIEVLIDWVNLKRGQIVYLHKDGSLNWKYSIREIGVVVEDQDKDGYVKIELNL